ncbi:unnamed protein product [Schistosoma margrebowiei]|uniref:Uncharacterized protein n=1 Tax=Schistosoma margrebowiei TaxID=48269 RepID=A0A3P8FC78_9TREM|nr:unnamed protein product [Schistosoma margrebowiei]
MLLRCLPASLFIHTGHSSYLPLSSSSPSSLSSSPSSSLNKQDYQQSLFQLIIQKIRLISSTNSHCHSNKPSFTHRSVSLTDGHYIHRLTYEFRMSELIIYTATDF